MRPIFVTGTYRSGTTYLARSLATCPDVSFAGDPFFPAFKHLRRDALRDFGSDVQVDAPLEDYYFDTTASGRLRAIQGATLSNVRPSDPIRLFEEVRRQAGTYAPSLVPHLGEMNLGNYRDLMSSWYELISNTYGSAHTVGFKEVWCTEFLPPMLSSFPELKALVVIRDITDVYRSSRNLATGGYPFYFFVKQWRKNVALALHAQALFPGSVYLLRFEDLISLNERTIDGIAGFFDISAVELRGALKHPRTEAGAQWSKNSSFQGGDGHLAAATRSQLCPDEILWLRILARSELEAMNYDIDDYSRSLNAPPPEAILNAVQRIEATEGPERIAAWLRPWSTKITEHSAEFESRRLQWSREDGQFPDEIEMLGDPLLFLSQTLPWRHPEL